MNNPTQYIILGAGDLVDSDSIETGSNLDWIKQRASERAGTFRNTQIVYKLVPVLEYHLEVTTKIVSKELE